MTIDVSIPPNNRRLVIGNIVSDNMVTAVTRDEFNNWQPAASSDDAAIKKFFGQTIGTGPNAPTGFDLLARMDEIKPFDQRARRRDTLLTMDARPEYYTPNPNALHEHELIEAAKLAGNPDVLEQEDLLQLQQLLANHVPPTPGKDTPVPGSEAEEREKLVEIESQKLQEGKVSGEKPVVPGDTPPSVPGSSAEREAQILKERQTTAGGEKPVVPVGNDTVVPEDDTMTLGKARDSLPVDNADNLPEKLGNAIRLILNLILSSNLFNNASTNTQGNHLEPVSWGNNTQVGVTPTTPWSSFR
jgi:hypothetical protein